MTIIVLNPMYVLSANCLYLKLLFEVREYNICQVPGDPLEILRLKKKEADLLVYMLHLWDSSNIISIVDT